MIKTFRGLIVDEGQDTIPLHTSDGSTGYRIVKFDIIPETPGNLEAEHIVKIFKIPQAGSSSVIDFNDQTLLAAGYINNDDDGYSNAFVPTIIFDNEIFNQDIYVTHKIRNGSGSINYYIELEQVKLSDNENAVATLKDIRNRARLS